MRVASLDAVRGTAAFSVAIPHFFMAQHQSVGLAEGISIVAVEVFFVLSGFVLAPQLIFCFQQRSYQNLRVFYVRRWVRTLPPFLFSLVLISGLFGELFSVDFFRYLFFIRNLFTFSEANDYFFPAWSLSVEEWFYVVFPLVLLFKVKGNPGQVACIFIAALLVVKVLLVAIDPLAVPHIRRIAALRLDAIAVGFLLYVVLNSSFATYPMLIKRMSAAAVLIFGMAVVGSLVSINASPSLWRELAFTSIAPLFGASIIAVAYAFKDAVAEMKCLSLVSIYAGRISYTVYLFHLPFILILNSTVQVAPALMFAIYLGSLIVFCLLFFQYVESPLLAARPRYTRNDEVGVLA